MGVFFAKFIEVAGVSSVKSKAGVATGDFEVMITLTRRIFMNIPNVMTSGGRPSYFVVEGRQPLCWSCGAVKILPRKEAGTTAPTMYKQLKQQ